MNILADFKKITTFIFDVDGVMTDGLLAVLKKGLLARTMNIKDGLAIKMALKNGYRVVVISGAKSDEAADRLKKLGIEEIHMGVKHKEELVAKYIVRNKLKDEEVLYMGDDLPDLLSMKMVGLPCCPANAVEEVRAAAKYISTLEGGRACVRDVIEKVLRLNDHWHYHSDITT